MSYNDDEYQESIARKIEDAINTLSMNTPKLAKTMARNMHRTNQQAFTRLAIEWLKVCGDMNYGHDGRNEASYKVGVALRGKLDDVYLPLI